MGRNILLGFAGPGKVTETNIDDLLNDYLELYDDVRVVIPASDEYLSKTVLMLLDWTVDSKIPYEAVYDVETRKNKRILDGSKGEIEARNVSLGLVDRLSAPEADEEVRLIVAYGEESEADEATEKLVDLAQTKGIKVLDLTSGLDDLHLGDDEDEQTEPEPEPEPRRRRTAKDKSLDDEPEQAPRPRRGKPREKPAEAPESVQEESVEAEVSRARHRAQTTTQVADKPLPVGADVVLHALTSSLSLVHSLDCAHAAMTLKPEVEPSALYKLLGEAIEKYTGSTEADLVTDPEEIQAEEPEDVSPKGGRPRKDGTPARKRTAAQRGVKEWQDEDGNWHKQGRGRPPKGVPMRTVDPKTGDVISED
jgi:hypothetical protein